MGGNSSEDEERSIVARTPAELQRLKLSKLMKNPEKPVMIPDRPKQKNNPNTPEFVRNVMGSSAGAGSGEFHVYRHLRRKEYSRQKFIQDKAHKELLDEEYHQKLENNKKKAEDLTAKKRAKRLKLKQKLKQKKFKPSDKNKRHLQDTKSSDSEDSTSDEEKSDNIEESNVETHDESKNESKTEKIEYLMKNEKSIAQDTNENDDADTEQVLTNASTNSSDQTQEEVMAKNVDDSSNNSNVDPKKEHCQKTDNLDESNENINTIENASKKLGS